MMAGAVADPGVVPGEGGRNPFRGPEPLRRGDGLYGREREVREIATYFLARRLLLLYAVSGTGKTSLLNAALLDEIAGEDRFHVLPLVSLRGAAADPADPGANPFLERVAAALRDGDDGRLGRALATGGITLAAFLDELRTRRRIGDDVRLALVVDDLDEVFVNPAAEAHREVFFSELGAAFRDRSTFAVLSMREEHLAALDGYAARFPLGQMARYRLQALTPAQAAEAVTGAVRARGMEIDPEVVDTVVANLAKVSVSRPDGSVAVVPGPFVEPVYLQAVFHDLWDRTVGAGKAAITRQDAGDVDVDRALGRYYDARVAAAARAGGFSEARLREWIQANMVRGDFAVPVLAAGVPIPPAVLDPLVRTGLFRKEQRNGLYWYELPHDRLVRPISESNRSSLGGSPLHALAQQWEREDETPRRLLNWGTYRRLAGTSTGSDLETRFLAASRRRHRRQGVAAGVAAVVLLAAVVGQSLYVQGVRNTYWKRATEVLDLQNELTFRSYAVVVQEAAELSPANDIRFRPRGIRPDSLALAANRDSARAWIASLPAPGRRGVVPVGVACDGCGVPAGALETLRGRGFGVAGGRSGGTARPNALVFERPDDLPLVREAAMALMAEGVPLSRIRLAFHDETHRALGPRIALRFEPDLQEWPPLAYRELLSMCVRGGPAPCGPAAGASPPGGRP